MRNHLLIGAALAAALAAALLARCARPGADSSTASNTEQKKVTVNSSLSGRATLTIEAVTHGTTFATASRFEYNLGDPH
jgi:ABC-type oligopeptide transport system substrate-binding subunit